MQTNADLTGKPPIDAALPSDVWTKGLGRFAAYQRYPRYTWPWFRRRAFVFWPVAIANGIFSGMWHASSVATWSDLFPLGSRAVLASILTVSVGPLLATFVRYRRLPYRTEAFLVVTSIIAGIV